MKRWVSFGYGPEKVGIARVEKLVPIFSTPTWVPPQEPRITRRTQEDPNFFISIRIDVESRFYELNRYIDSTNISL